MMAFLDRLLSRRKAKPQRAHDAAPDWRRNMRRRIVAAIGVLSLWVAGIEARLVYLQVHQHAELKARAQRQQSGTIPTPARRGDILDRRGRVLATSVDADSIYGVPREIDDAEGVASTLCAALENCTPQERAALAERFSRSGEFAYVRRRVSPEEARRVAALNLDGIGFFKESRRFYPNKQLAAHLLGYVGLDNNGLSGVESTFDEQISGKAGTVIVQTDARRHAFARFERPPTSGASVELTIDQYLQHIAERELAAGVADNRAAGGTAIVMDPRTGEILAMANEPTFNPNAFLESQERERRNRAVQDLYEPGSTFKVVTASGAIEENLMPLDTPIDVSGGRIRFGARVISDVHAYGTLSFTDVIVKSSNVGAIKIGLRLGADRLSEYVARFGFGRRVSPDFPSENPGIVWPASRLNDSAIASVSIGYQVGVTPLQMAAAVSAVANGGEYIEPRILRAAYRGNRRYDVTPKVLRRIISDDTALKLTTIMEQVVERGTAKTAQIPGYAIAGKTGTANKLVNGRYSNFTYASFVGFLPAEDPAITILVVLDSPRGRNGRFGGPVAGPIFRRIADAAIRYLGIPPSLNAAPPVLVARRDDADGTLASAVAAAAPERVVNLVAEAPPGTMPDLRGLSAREAVRQAGLVGLIPRVSGDGVVVAQDPPPGSPVEQGDASTISLDRAPVEVPAAVVTTTASPASQ
jgi:cell division protein FtsI (penicillin-binding protein 3)